MGQSPSDIRAEIEETRARVGDEVDALSYKTDVPARVGDYVDEKKRALKDKVTGAKDAITDTASDAVPSGRQIGKLKDTAERNPLGLVVGGAAIGLLTGLLLPSTRVEDRQMGEMSDRVVDAAKDTARRGARERQTGGAGGRRQRDRARAGARVEPAGTRPGLARWYAQHGIGERRGAGPGRRTAPARPRLRLEPTRDGGP